MRRITFGAMLGVFVAAACGAGCKSTPSVDLATSDISAFIRVSAKSASGSEVRVEMSPGAGVVPTDVVKLAGGDALYAEAGAQRRQLGARPQTSFAIAAATS